jgi:hypothetical protein
MPVSVFRANLDEGVVRLFANYFAGSSTSFLRARALLKAPNSKPQAPEKTPNPKLQSGDCALVFDAWCLDFEAWSF